MVVRLQKHVQVEVLKADDELGLVFGRAIICTKRGKPYYDTQGDHVPEETMLEASLDFSKNSRQADVMHDDVAQGTAVFVMPITKDIAKQFGISCDWTGLMIGAQVSPEVFARVKKGELKSFSIGGERGEDEVVEEDDEGSK